MAWCPPSSGTPSYQDEASVSHQSGHRGYRGPLPLQYPNLHPQWGMYAVRYQLSHGQHDESGRHQTGQPYPQELRQEHRDQNFDWLHDQQQQQHGHHHHHHQQQHGHQHQHHYEQGYHQQQHEDRPWDQACHHQQYTVQQHGQYHQQQHDQYHQKQHEDHSWGRVYHHQQQYDPQQHSQSHTHQQSTLRTFATGPHQHVLVPHGYVWQAADCNFDELTDYDTSAIERAHQPRMHAQDQFADAAGSTGSGSLGMIVNSQEEETEDYEQTGYYGGSDGIDHDGSEYWSDGPHIYPRSPVHTRKQSTVSPPPSCTDTAPIFTSHSALSHQTSLADSGGNLYPPTVASDDCGEDDIQDQQKGGKRYRAWSEDECQRLMTCVATQALEASHARAMRAAAGRSRKPRSIASGGIESTTLGPAPPKGKNWHRIAELMGNGRTWAGCSNKYQKMMRQAKVE